MKTKQIVMYGFAATILSAFLTGGKENLQQLQATRDSQSAYAQALTGNKVATANAGKESELAWQMVQREGVVPVVGLTPKVNEWSFVPVSLAVGDVATVGGKKEQSYAPGTLLGDATGRIGRVGMSGKVESPINGSQNPGFLPVIPAANLEAYSQTILALKARPNMPQAVVSSLQELAKRRMDIEERNQIAPVSQSVPIKKAEPLPTPQVSPVPPVSQTPSPTAVAVKPQSYPTFQEIESANDLPKVNLE